MKDFLSKFKPDSNVNVGVSVSPNIGLEMMVVDVTQHKVVKYAHRPLVYNFSSREIEDYAEFKKLLLELFKELSIDPKNANVVLNLPSVAFGHSYLPSILDDEGVTGALVSKVEESYLFKKNNPVVSWHEVRVNNTSDKRYILYSAMQEGVIDIVKQVFSEIGSILVAIENSYSSLIKTLEYTGLVNDFAQSHGSWNILLISQNSYAVFSLLNYDVIEYYEDPLAIKSFSGDDVYIAISQAASSVLEKYPTDKLLVISESNDVSAEILAMQMKYQGDVVFLECNQYAKSTIMDVDFNILPSYVKGISLEAIGAAIYRSRDFSLKLNFLQDNSAQSQTTVNVLGYELTQEQLYLYSGVLGLFIIVISFLFTFALNIYNGNLESKRNVLDEESIVLQAEFENLKKTNDKIDIYSVAKSIDYFMASKVIFYQAIGTNIPSHVWLNSFYVDSSGAYGLEGETTSVDEVYLFFRNIKAQVPKSNLFLSKLMVDDADGVIDIEKAKNANYSFALSNNRYIEVQKRMQEATALTDEITKLGSGADGGLPDLPPALP